MESALNFPILLSNLAQGGIFWLIFLLVIVVVGIYSLLLLYHWIRYGMNSATTWVVMFVYFAVAIFLSGIMLLSVMGIK